MELNKLIRNNIQQLESYSSARKELFNASSILLDANESPIETDYNRYPDPLQRQVKRRIGDLMGVCPDTIFLGNGSDEAIDLLIRACCEPQQDSILVVEPTYGMYEVCARIHGAHVRKVALDETFQTTYEKLQVQCDETVKIIFLCSPNNPTGNLLDKVLITQLASNFHGLVVIDEAYIDFADDDGFLPILKNYKNMVVLQTFSKSWGLAGLRLGVCYADPIIIGVLDRIKYPYNISSATQRVVLEQLASPYRKNLVVDNILRQRQAVSEALSQLRCVVHVYPSDANFVLVKFANAAAVHQFLLRRNLVVRDRSGTNGCENCLRISIGTENENQMLLKTLRRYDQESTIY